MRFPVKWLVRFGVVGAVAATAAYAALPVFGDNSGSVTATVSVSGVSCITLNTSSTSFGTLPFTTATSISSGQSTDGVYATNCGQNSEDLYAHATDATGSSGADWSLIDLGSGGATASNLCSSPNRYGLYFVQSSQYLTTSDQELNAVPTPLPAGVPTTISSLAIFMPCTGSSGSGQTMSLSVVFTAVLAS